MTLTVLTDPKSIKAARKRAIFFQDESKTVRINPSFHQPDGDFFHFARKFFVLTKKDLAWSSAGISKLHLRRMSLTLVSTLIWQGLNILNSNSSKSRKLIPPRLRVNEAD